MEPTNVSSTIVDKKLKPLSVVEKAGYAAGDAASNIYFQIFITFLMIFYTDVFGLPAAAVGTMFLVSRIFDAINDPLIGALSRSEEHTSELQSRGHLVCRLLLEKKKGNPSSRGDRRRHRTRSAGRADHHHPFRLSAAPARLGHGAGRGRRRQQRARRRSGGARRD